MRKYVDLVIKNIKAYTGKVQQVLEKLKGNKRLFFTIIGLLSILLLLDVNSVSRSKIPVKMVKVGNGNIVVTVSAPGVVKATNVKLGVRVPGVVEWIGVKEGARVEKDEILLKLDSYENALREYKRIKDLHQKGFATSQQLENAKYILDGSAIRSPIDGIISSVAIDVGEPATMGYPLITVLSLKGMSIELQIDQVDIAQINHNAEVKVMSDAYPNEMFEGKLVWVNSEAEPKVVAGTVPDEEDRIFRGKVELNEQNVKLFPGMNVDVDIMTQKLNDVLVVPRDSIISENDQYYVQVIKFGRSYKRDINIGLKDSYNVEIKSGVKKGETVAASNVFKLKNGSRVKVERKK